MTGTVEVEDRNYGAESFRWAIFWTPAADPIIGDMKKLQDSMLPAISTCFFNTKGGGLQDYATCLIRERSDRGVYMAAKISDVSSFDPATFVVVDDWDASYQIFAMPQFYWYRSSSNQVKF